MPADLPPAIREHERPGVGVPAAHLALELDGFDLAGEPRGELPGHGDVAVLLVLGELRAAGLVADALVHLDDGLSKVDVAALEGSRFAPPQARQRAAADEREPAREVRFAGPKERRALRLREVAIAALAG